MKALVTGGGGFLGSRIAALLSERGDDVTVLGRRRYAGLERMGIRAVQADLRDRDAVTEACRGKDVVFHAGAMTGIWGPAKEFYDINVTGTRNVLHACRKHGVGRLVYTSSPSVVFGKEELCGVDESHPYPDRFLTDYPKTKAQAERDVLTANGPDLLTLAIRPHLIWGPGDPHLIPRVVARARAGRLRQVGDGQNLVDITYIDNAAQAHLNAADRLTPGADCRGKAYFISQGTPVLLWSWIADLLQRLGIQAPLKRIPYGAAYFTGWALEAVFGLLRARREPPMTRFVAAQLAKSHYFNIDAARAAISYQPAISTEQGIDRLIEWLESPDGSPAKQVAVPG